MAKTTNAKARSADPGKLRWVKLPRQARSRDKLERFVAAAAERPGIVHVPVAAMQAAGLLAQAAAAVLRRTPPLSPYRIASALAPMRFDCQAARQRLGWTPRIGVRRGLDLVFSQSSAVTNAVKDSHS